MEQVCHLLRNAMLQVSLYPIHSTPPHHLHNPSTYTRTTNQQPTPTHVHAHAHPPTWRYVLIMRCLHRMRTLISQGIPAELTSKPRQKQKHYANTRILKLSPLGGMTWVTGYSVGHIMDLWTKLQQNTHHHLFCPKKELPSDHINIHFTKRNVIYNSLPQSQCSCTGLW